MPKGIPATKTQLELTVVPAGSKFFPGSERPIPEGVTVRSGRGVQIEFMYNGTRYTETLKGTPTVKHVMEAAAKRDRVIKAIGLGLFNYAIEFPNSRRSGLSEGPAKRTHMPTIGEALNEWLECRENTVGENAFKDYTKDVRHQLKPMPLYYLDSTSTPEDKRRPGQLQDLPADQLSAANINNIRSWLLAKPVSKKRVMNILTPLRGTLADLASGNLANGVKIPADPFLNVRPLKVRKVKEHKSKPDGSDWLDEPLPIDDLAQFAAEEGEPDPFTPDEIKALCSELSGPFLNLVVFWLWTGLRTGELIALRWNDIDWTNGRMYIRRSVSRGVLKRPKNDRFRWVRLLEPARKALEAQSAHTGQIGEWVFLNPWTGRRWANESKIRTRFKKALDLAGVPYRRPYQCRHTYASTLLSSGESPLFVAEQMGHKDWSMIIKVYGRWIEGVDKHVGQRVADMHLIQWRELAAVLSSKQANLEDLANENELEEPDSIGDLMLE